MGIYFAKKKPQQQLYVLPLINDQFTIPPGDSNYKVSAPADGPISTPFGLHLWGIYPHMHLLGRKMNVAAHLPGGSDECLINIDDWDFNWQGLYQYKSPIAIPAGPPAVHANEKFVKHPARTEMIVNEIAKFVKLPHARESSCL